MKKGICVQSLICESENVCLRRDSTWCFCWH